MKNFLTVLLLVLVVSSCTNDTFVAGKRKKERNELYKYSDDEVYCKNNPDKCIKGVPWD